MSAPGGGVATTLPREVTGTILLVRHAQSTWVAEERFQGRLDPPLSPLGEAQARRLGAWLATRGGPPGLGLVGDPVEIAHSPLARVAQTATAIVTAFEERAPQGPAPRLRPDPGFLEIGVGAWEGLTIGEVEARWPAEHAAWRADALDNPPPGGESLRAAAERVASTIPALAAALAPRSGSDGARAAERGSRPWSIVVAHGGILRLLLFALVGLPLDRFWAFPFALASVSVVGIADGRASLLAHNLPAHLGGRDPDDAAGGGLRAF